MSLALGKIDFSDTPTVAGSNVLTEAGLPTQLTNLVVPGNEGLTIPRGTTAQRPTVPIVGETRWNTTDGNPEIWSGSAWLPFARTLQTVNGTIAGNSSSGNHTSQTTAPPSTTGALLWSASITPIVVGSNIVVQYSVTSTAAAAKSTYTAVFNGTSCIGLVAGSFAANGYTNMMMQAVTVSTSTAPMTLTARGGNLNSTAITYFNRGVSGTFADTMVTEFRILEII